jgi:ribosomal protein S18 acetylase RimI-like enzyme
MNETDGNELRVVPALPGDLARYLALMEEIAAWLAARGIRQWPVGGFQQAKDYYAGSIARGEVHLAFAGHDLAGALRLLLSEPDVWPDAAADEAVYLFSLAVRRAYAAQGLGGRLLHWAEARAAALGKTFVRLDCLADNPVLRGYYTQAGYAERGEITACYPAPVGTLCLRRFEKRVR